MHRALLIIFILCGSPIFAEEDIDKDIEALQKHSEEAAKKIEQIQEKMKAKPSPTVNPLQKSMSKLQGDPKFASAAKKVLEHPDRKNVVIAILVFLVAHFILRMMVMAMIEHGLIRFVVGLAFFFLRWAGVAYFIPVYFYGDAYRYLAISFWGIISPF